MMGLKNKEGFQRILSMCIILCLMLLTGVQVYGQAQSITVKATISEDRTVEVKGVITPAQGQKITLLVMKPKEPPYSLNDLRPANVADIVYGADQVPTDNGGVYRFGFRMSETADSGWYQIRVGGTGVNLSENLRSGTFYYANPAEMVRVVLQVNSANAQTMETALQSPVLNLALTGEYQAAKEEVNRLLVNLRLEALNQKYSSVKDVQEAFQKALGLALLNKAQISEISNLFDIYGTAWGIDLESDYKKVKAAAIEKLLMFREERTDKKFPNMTEFLAAFEKSLAIAMINNSSRSEITDVLEYYKKTLGFASMKEYEDYKNLGNNRIEVNKALTSQSFKSVQEIQESFKKRLQEVKDQLASTGRNSSPSSRSPSKPSYVIANPSINEEQPAKVENTEAQKISFVDLENVEWAKESIESLASKGILKGTDEKRFNPNDNVTREQFTKMIMSAFQLSDPNAENSFQDCEKEAWYYPYISSAKSLGVIQGVNEADFGIGRSITRQEMVVIIDRVVQKVNINLEKIKPSVDFEDADKIAPYAQAGIQRMQQAGIVNGVGNNKFAPDQFASRAEAAEILWKLLKKYTKQ